MRSVSLADPQGPRSRRTSGALSVSENENDLSRESVLFVERKKASCKQAGQRCCFTNLSFDWKTSKRLAFPQSIKTEPKYKNNTWNLTLFSVTYLDGDNVWQSVYLRINFLCILSFLLELFINNISEGTFGIWPNFRMAITTVPSFSCSPRVSSIR